MENFSTFLIVFVMAALQYFMSRSRILFLGAIIPIIYVITMIVMYKENYITSTLLFVGLLIIGLIILLEQWSKGRKDTKNKQKSEIEKMKKRDL
ncbi:MULTISPECIES: hypothetical protein [Staphylococcus]|uniref:Permease n=1 Tax=Staphylococcus equorum TaxID=246432 RepID=A0AAW7AJA9_9STAP|nr:hypothetical protein [Staphylococcus equorum]MDK9865730.1 hypothetical protein [Staphylococcus equorum]